MSVPDTLSHLSPNVARHTLYVLTSLLPAPLTDMPEERTARDQAAIDAVAALKPADAFEAMLAARIVGANAHALDCLRRIGTLGEDSEAAEKCWSRAGLMTRLADAALHTRATAKSARESRGGTVAQ
jgi:hypothetical protein